MILTTSVPVKVGEVTIARRVRLDDGTHHNQPLFIIREASREEWEAQWRRIEPRSPGPYFYEVSTD